MIAAVCPAPVVLAGKLYSFAIAGGVRRVARRLWRGNVTPPPAARLRLRPIVEPQHGNDDVPQLRWQIQLASAPPIGAVLGLIKPQRRPERLVHRGNRTRDDDGAPREIDRSDRQIELLREGFDAGDIGRISAKSACEFLTAQEGRLPTHVQGREPP
jgi:hypothetical protein